MTGSHDPDRALERLLRRSGGPAAPSASCVDAEVLAAWADGGLAAAERRSVEQHLSTCARCREAAALLAVATPAAARVVPFWRRPSIRWVVPIGAAAAAAILWMVLPVGPTTPSSPRTIARLESEAPPTDDLRDSTRAPEPAATPQPGRAPASPPPGDAERRLQERAREQPSQKASGAMDDRTAASEADAPAPAALAAPPPPDAAAPQAGPAPISPQVPAPAPAPAPAAAPAAPTSQAESPNGAAAAAARTATATRPLRFEAGSAVVEVVSPDPLRRWRLTSGRVTRSDDGGRSWQQISLPSGASPTSGVAPAPHVCWLVGAAGLVLRSIDGATFEAVTVPGAGDLVSVRATDENNATVTTADGRQFSTGNGGRTWETP